VDVAKLLDYASRMASENNVNQPLGRIPGFVLGTIMGEAALHGRDKLTIIADPEVAPLGAWLEQLIAESSGKQGKGILPVNGEIIANPKLYGTDRLFIYIRRSGKYDAKAKLLRKAGNPVIKQDFTENYALGAEFYMWELAVAMACSILGVNAFDQPDVQDSKNRTVAKISYYLEHHGFNENQPIYEDHGISLYGNLLDGKGVTGLVGKFLDFGKPGDYVAINAYLDRDKKNSANLQALRSWIMSKTKLATTLGFGPRFQHSTGQLHKGGKNNGLFLVVTADPLKDTQIPEEGLSFGMMEHGQFLGDMEALQARGRRVLRIHLSNPEYLKTLVEKLVH
jgi:transaldolase/glucose-6-phosphate isomerase